MDQDTKKFLAIVEAVAELIRDLGSVPSGHLYARLSSHFSLDQYNKILAILKHGKMVEESGFVLRWVGPPKEAP
jgi:hypothetical protein